MHLKLCNFSATSITRTLESFNPIEAFWICLRPWVLLVDLTEFRDSDLLIPRWSKNKRLGIFKVNKKNCTFWIWSSYVNKRRGFSLTQYIHFVKKLCPNKSEKCSKLHIIYLNYKNSSSLHGCSKRTHKHKAQSELGHVHWD